MVSDGEKRSAEEGRGGCGGNMFDRAGSKVNSKSAKGTGGGIGEVDIVERGRRWIKGRSVALQDLVGPLDQSQ